MRGLLPRFISLSLDRPRRVLVAWALILGVSVALALQLESSLSAGGFTDPRAEAIVTQGLVEDTFGDEPNQMLVALESTHAITTADYEAFGAVLRDAGATTIATPRDRPELAADDERTAVLIAGFRGDNSAVQNLTPALQQALSDASPAGLTAYLTGQPALDYQLNMHSKEDAVRAELIVFPLLIVVLFLVFRSVVATAVPLVMAGAALGIASGIGYLATRFTDISVLYTNIVSMIGLAVAVDYSLFIVKRYREELDSGAGTRAALDRAFETAGRSVLFSGIAVAVALAALFIPGLMAFTSIALGGIVVTIVALALTLTALPAALVLIGARINWGTARWLARRLDTPRPRRHTSRVAGLVGIAAMIALAAPIIGISLQSPVASASILPADDPARVGLEVVEQGVGNQGLFPIQLVLSAPNTVPIGDALVDVRAVSEYATNHPGVSSVISITNQGVPTDSLIAALQSSDIPDGLAAAWAEHEGDWVTRILVTADAAPDSTEAHQLVRDLRSYAPSGDLSLAVTGATAQGIDFDSTLVGSMPWIVAFVFVLTFLMLVLAFRSALLPLLAVGFNALVVLASLGVLTAVIGFGGGGEINSVTPVLLFAVMFGLSMDYMVIIISRIIEAYRGGLPFDDAVSFGTQQTRSMINSAAIIMIAVFASFSTAQISIVREIGIGLGVAVLFDALIIRVYVMPAVLRLIGPRVLGARPFVHHDAPSPRVAKIRDVIPFSQSTS